MTELLNLCVMYVHAPTYIQCCVLKWFLHICQSYCMLFTHKRYQHDPQSSNDCHVTTMASS